jgi:2-amino-4-hydroxy-6-hydroxymethyldihydropteridine diphosphokinase
MTRASPDPERSTGESCWVRGAIGLGSNLGDRAAHLDRAVLEIGAIPGVRFLAVSDWIETDPVGGPAGAPRYLNGVLLLETELSARRLLQELLALERAHGRVRTPTVGRGAGEPRTLDLDLLFLGDSRIDEPGLVVPHPGLEERTFVLAPLAQVAPNLVLASGRTARQRLEELAHAPR